MQEKKEHSEVFKLDIEDLVKLGKRECFCPYYAVKENAKHADLILMPYTYLFDEDIRRSIKIPITNQIIIIDEAHNIQKVAEEACSFEFNTTTMKIMAATLFKLIDTKSQLASKRKKQKQEKALGATLIDKIVFLHHVIEQFRQYCYNFKYNDFAQSYMRGKNNEMTNFNEVGPSGMLSN